MTFFVPCFPVFRLITETSSKYTFAIQMREYMEPKIPKFLLTLRCKNSAEIISYMVPFSHSKFKQSKVKTANLTRMIEK